MSAGEQEVVSKTRNLQGLPGAYTADMCIVLCVNQY
jgi:hypothetical protein